MDKYPSLPPVNRRRSARTINGGLMEVAQIDGGDEGGPTVAPSMGAHCGAWSSPPGQGAYQILKRGMGKSKELRNLRKSGAYIAIQKAQVKPAEMAITERYVAQVAEYYGYNQDVVRPVAAELPSEMSGEGYAKANLRIANIKANVYWEWDGSQSPGSSGNVTRSVKSGGIQSGA
ncbi:hypothetical protein B0H17DRAFT_1149746 [Mycena rosella]|uniref:Uncharacterized protein n=1 Tax=Mycena rosella TaxID=1033263 RepID=A0AAD7BYF1_MYCRO|nr:hypothetical protein B0H17DRAFT_1149746 [Mycena rosella]